MRLFEKPCNSLDFRSKSQAFDQDYFSRSIYYDKSSEDQIITCGVPHWPKLVPLLFVWIGVNDLPSATTLLDPIMFQYDTNLFYYQKNLRFRLNTVNNGLDHFRKWFNASKLYLSNGVVFETYLDSRFQRPQEGLNCESLAYKVITK